jgi:hypothetical protein
MSEAQRGYFYRLALALIALAGIVGRITGYAVDQDLLSQISNIVAIVFGLGAAGLATRNTAVKADPNAPVDPPRDDSHVTVLDDPIAPTDLPPAS